MHYKQIDDDDDDAYVSFVCFPITSRQISAVIGRSYVGGLLCIVSAVCKKSFEFLVGVNDEPLIDIDQVNEHLYEHVAALYEAMV